LQEKNLNTGWIIFGIIVVFMLGAALPLLRKDDPRNARPLPKKETLNDWRNNKDA
jgi:hypothetical protein